ncbi:MAG: IS1595 family transposase [Rhizobiales bacterium]|nr:IS1595 family transposase [Hyphomicrobiales bacterium]
MKSVLNDKHFHDEKAAYKWVEARVWPEGPVCPHCGGVERISAMKGKSTRIGAYKCYQCRKPFTVKVGTIFESSHIPMKLWLQAIFLMTSSKKGISSNQLHRTLGCTLKTAWFMSHRIREAMREGGLAPMGGGGGIVEADETYFGKVGAAKTRTKTTSGRKFTKGGRTGPSNKREILSLVERGGKVRSFHVQNADKVSVANIVKENVSRETRLHTDESRLYHGADEYFQTHETVKHSIKEYARGDIHVNSAEGFFGIFKRGMRGVYQHCSEKHLHRYLAEYDFRYNHRIALGTNDEGRAAMALKGAVGKRLTYETIG